jgi:hypothetical protein
MPWVASLLRDVPWGVAVERSGRWDRELAWTAYLDLAMRRGRNDPVVDRAIRRVLGLGAPTGELLHPRVLVPVLAQGVRDRRPPGRPG